ncbi:MAG: C4-type zinc ribbon domain-containing protein [Bacteroidales bacterium]|nr:C4-type zinc ribbon domain-containing protein [Bacteroidales bacterium]
MAKKENPVVETTDLSVEEKLKALFSLQSIDSQIDNIIKLRGELPLEVQDLEDEVMGLETRYHKYLDEIKNLEQKVSGKKIEIKKAEDLIKKYTEQQSNVRNNREYDAINKEIEFQQLEIQLCEKHIKEFNTQIEQLKNESTVTKETLEKRKADLELKRKELAEIIEETQKEEEQLREQSLNLEKLIEPRLLTAYKRIRKNARNGLAVVKVQRDACGGCFAKIPPQRQLEIRSRKKIIVCEYCGRILIDPEL